jgi:hypothetical protein
MAWRPSSNLAIPLFAFKNLLLHLQKGVTTMRIKKTAAFCLAFALAAGFPSFATPAFAAGYSDTDGHWGAAAIEKWSDYGVLHGNGDGSFAPDRAMTQDELATVLTNSFGYTAAYDGALPGYTGAWGESAVRKAIAAGALAPEEAALPLTRELAVKIIAKAYHIEPKTGATGFADDADTGEAYRGYVAAFREKGYARGTGADAFSPKKAYTRAEAMQVIDNMVGAIHGEAGERTGDVAGTLIVNASGVTVKESAVSGDLIIADGVGEGDATLDNVTVAGRLLVRGGGEHSIRLLGAKTVIPNVLVYKSVSAAPVRIVFESGVRIENVTVENPAIIEVREGAKIAALTINDARVSVSAVRGSVTSVEIAADIAGDIPAGAVNTNVAPGATAAAGGGASSGGSSGGGGGGGGNGGSSEDDPDAPPVDLSEYTEVTTFGGIQTELGKGTKKILLSGSATAESNLNIPSGTELLIVGTYLNIPETYTLTVEGRIVLGIDESTYGYEGYGLIYYSNTDFELDTANIDVISGYISVYMRSLTDDAARGYLVNDKIRILYSASSITVSEDVTIPGDKQAYFSHTLTIDNGAVLTVEGVLEVPSLSQVILKDGGQLIRAPGGVVSYDVDDVDNSDDLLEALSHGYSVDVNVPITINGDLAIPAGSYIDLGTDGSLTINGNLTINGALNMLASPLVVSGTLSIGPATNGIGYNKNGTLHFYTDGPEVPTATVGGKQLFGSNSILAGSDGNTADIYVSVDQGIGLHQGTNGVAEDLTLAATDKIMVGRRAALEIAAGKTLTFEGGGSLASRLYGEDGALLTLQSGASIRIGGADAGLEDNSVYEWKNGAWQKLIATD